MNLWECVLFAVIAGIGVEITAQRTGCPSLSLKNGRIRIRQNKMAYFRCKKKFTRVGPKFAVCLSSGTWSQQAPVCVGRGCPDLGSLPDVTVTEEYNGGVLHFECSAGMRRQGPQTLMCDGSKWDAAPPKCLYGVSLGCDFEDSSLCGWSQDANDDFDWTWTSGATPTAGTGPEGDHTTGKGHYIYMESSAPQKPGHVTRLISPPYGPTEEMCLSFFYHMLGPEKPGDVGDLDVYVRTEGDQDGDQQVFHREGNQGPAWMKGDVVIPRQQSVFSIVFAATRRESWTGDIALDDISVFKCSERHLYDTSTPALGSTPVIEGSSFDTSSTTDFSDSTMTMKPSQPATTTQQRRTSTSSQSPGTTTPTTSPTVTTVSTRATTTTTSAPTTPSTAATTATATTTSTVITSVFSETMTTFTTMIATETTRAEMAEKENRPSTTSTSFATSTTPPSTEGAETSVSTKAGPEHERSAVEAEGSSTLTSSFVTELSSVTSLSLDEGRTSPSTGSDAVYTDQSSGSSDMRGETKKNQIGNSDNDSSDNDDENDSTSSEKIDEENGNESSEDYPADNGHVEEEPGADNAQAREKGANYLPLIVGVTLGLAVGMAVISVLAWMWARNRRKKFERQVEEDQMNIIGSIEGNPYQQ